MDLRRLVIVGTTLHNSKTISLLLHLTTVVWGGSNRELKFYFYHKDQMIEDIIAVADSINIGTFHRYGHDLGDAIAKEMTFMNRERIIINEAVINNSLSQAASKTSVK